MSLNAYIITSVINYFISKEGKRRYIVFGLYKIVNKHTSKNIAGVFIDLFCDYGIISNIRYFIADNTELNNIYLNAILYILYLNILVKIYKER